MELEQFRKELLDGIYLDASSGGSLPQEEFLKYCSSVLIDAEEIDDFEPLAFEGQGSRGRHIQMDGYYYDELDHILNIMICRFDGSPSIQTLTDTEARSCFRRATGFIEDARSGYILKNAEESAPGYGFAWTIKKDYGELARYKIYILTDMLMSARINEIQNTAIDGVPVEYHIWDVGRLQKLVSSKSGKEEIVINLKEFSNTGIPCLPAGTTKDYTAYLCNIPGLVLARLYLQYGGRLLEGNVRSFLTSRPKVNKGIRNTIINKPDLFFAFNNGIAATASDVGLENGSDGTRLVEIRDLQIVNGGQTTASLASALVKDKDQVDGLKNIFVPMKLSVVSPEKAALLVPDIARYANSQNKISEADLFSNHPFHRRMEDHSRRLMAPAVMGRQYGTIWYYERTRGQYRQEQAGLSRAAKNKFLARNPKSQMFTKTDLGKFHELYRELPFQVASGAQKNFMKFADWAAAEWEKDEAQFNEEFFRRIVALNILFRKADRIISKAPWYEKGYKAQIAAYTLSMLFHLIRRDGLALDFKSIWLRQDITQAAENQIQELAAEVHRALLDPGRGAQNVTEWAKREACWAGMQSLSLNLNDAFKRELITVAAASEESRTARSRQKEDNKIDFMTKVFEYGQENWKQLISWGYRSGEIPVPDLRLLENSVVKMKQGHFPGERQCQRLLQILHRARENSYPN